MNFTVSGLFTLFLQPGKYLLQCYGADGAGSYSGKGGYSRGIIRITKNTDIFINVGGKGNEAIIRTAYGGYNGGGNGYTNKKDYSDAEMARSLPTNDTPPIIQNPVSGNPQVFGGGGASDIRIGSDSLNNRVIVAGGGGGGVYLSYYQPNEKLRYGGGEKVENYLYGLGQDCPTNFDDNYVSYCGGGGGGWYGGRAGVNSSGNGGSGFVYTFHTNQNLKTITGSKLNFINLTSDAYLIKPFTTFTTPYYESDTHFGYQFEDVTEQNEWQKPDPNNGDGFVKITPLESYSTITDNGIIYNCDANNCGVLAIGEQTYVQIPSTVQTRIVNRIEEYACFGKENLTTLYLPDTIEEIREGAFFCAINLNTIVFGASSKLRTIGPLAFSNTSIIRLTLPSSLKLIDKYAFRYSKLQSIIFNEELEEIGKYAFSNTNLESVRIFSKLKTIGDFAFSNNENLNNASFLAGTNLINVGVNCFANSNITDFEMSPNLEYLSSYMFYNTSKLNSITFPQNGKLKIIKDYCFKDSKMPQISIPSTVVSIGEYAFSPNIINGPNSLSIYSVTFSNQSKLKVLKTRCFCGSYITNITIPKTVEFIGSHAFTFCNKLTSISFESGSNLAFIGDACFSNTNITSFVVPNSLTLISGSAFSGCDQLSLVTFEEGSYCTTIFGIAFSGTKVTSITIPPSVVTIRSQAFVNCDSLKQVITCNELIVFANDAFLFCRSLKFVNVSVDYIYDNAAGLPVVRNINTCPRISSTINIKPIPIRKQTCVPSYLKLTRIHRR